MSASDTHALVSELRARPPPVLLGHEKTRLRSIRTGWIGVNGAYERQTRE